MLMHTIPDIETEIYPLAALKSALEKLGHNVYHMVECVTGWQENHIHLFKEATRANLLGEGKLCTRAEPDKVLQNYTVRIDTRGKSAFLASIISRQSRIFLAFTLSMS